MAEIKSTMEMVMERAAQMAAQAGDADFAAEEKGKEGMRLAAAFMRDEVQSLTERLGSMAPGDLPHVQKGAVESLLRNIFLAREAEKQGTAEKAMHGLVELGRGDGQLLQVFSEMKKILDGYRQHGEQLKQQLEAQFAQQMEMMEKNLAKQTGVAMKLQPAQHPKFQEEWGRIQSQLDEQYGRALQQLKALVEQHLTR
ncbi:DUF6657 family protein [Thiovibrio sp. JS02]